MVISHVLEHLEEPARILGKLLQAAVQVGVRRVLVIVPGRAGFRIDDTHRTFVDRALLEEAGIVQDTGLAVQRSRYFPGDLRAIGDWFPHHELQVLYTRRTELAGAVWKLDPLGEKHASSVHASIPECRRKRPMGASLVGFSARSSREGLAPTGRS